METMVSMSLETFVTARRTEGTFASDVLISTMAERTRSSRMGHGVVGLEGDAECRERLGDRRDIAEGGRDRGSAELDGETRLASRDAVGHIVGLDLLGSAPMNARALV
jgi:hypothetical protein